MPPPPTMAAVKTVADSDVHDRYLERLAQSQQLRSYFKGHLTHYLFPDFFEHCLGLPLIQSCDRLCETLQFSDAAPRSETPFLSSVERPERVYTYGQVNQLANRIAHFFLSHAALELAPGAIVGLWMENSPEYFIICLGLAKLGYTVLLLPTGWTPKLLSEGLKGIPCSAMIVSKTYQEPFEHWLASAKQESQAMSDMEERLDAKWRFLAYVDLDSIDADLATRSTCRAGSFTCSESDTQVIPHLFSCLGHASSANPSDGRRAHLDADTPLFLIFTSGTTGGKLKCARFSHARYLGCAFNWVPHVGLQGKDRVYNPLPMYHGNGGVILPSSVLLVGAMLYSRLSFSASQFWSDVDSLGCLVTSYIGECWRYVLLKDKASDRRRRLKATLGNGLSPLVWQSIQARYDIDRIVEHYGATEMPGDALVNSYGQEGACGYLPPSVADPMGHCASAASPILARIESEEPRRPLRDAVSGLLSLCSVDEPGEVLFPLVSAQPYQGYVNQPTANESKVYRNVLAAGDAWWSSGDILRRDREGYYYFVDRVGSSYRWKGENVACALVSEILLKGLQSKDAGVGSAVTVADVLTFGVAVSHNDGKAGMVLIRLEADTARHGDDSWKAFIPQLLAQVQMINAAQLARHCQPVFLRFTTDEPTKTANMKYLVQKYAAQGFSLPPDAMEDEIYFRHRHAQDYVKLTREAWQGIQQGQFEF